MYQVFKLRTLKDQELFRVAIGSYSGKQLVSAWNYGIVDEADFNGDGKPDYSWYAGDDTGQEERLFLSSVSGYQEVDLFKTAEAAWHREFSKTKIDLENLDSHYQLTSTVLERTAEGLILHVIVVYDPQDYREKAKTFRLNIKQSELLS